MIRVWRICNISLVPPRHGPAALAASSSARDTDPRPVANLDWMYAGLAVAGTDMRHLSRHDPARGFPAHEVVIRVGEGRVGGLAPATQLKIE